MDIYALTKIASSFPGLLSWCLVKILFTAYPVTTEYIRTWFARGIQATTEKLADSQHAAEMFKAKSSISFSTDDHGGYTSKESIGGWCDDARG